MIVAHEEVARAHFPRAFVRAEEFGFLLRAISRANGREAVAVDGALMDVAEEHQPAPFGRPLVALINADSRVRRAVMAPVHDGGQSLARQVADVAVGIRPGAA